MPSPKRIHQTAQLLTVLSLTAFMSNTYADLNLTNGAVIRFTDNTTMSTAAGTAPADHGGTGNTVNGTDSFIGGGSGNTTNGNSATISGGVNNTTGNYSEATISGGYNNSSSGNFTTIAGGGHNNASGYFSATISGGTFNTASANYSSVGGGRNNDADGYASTVGGGRANTASGYGATVGGGGAFGYGNTAGNSFATVSGGRGNSAGGYKSTVAGGESNEAAGTRSTVGGGYSNLSNGTYSSTIAGGFDNTASGSNSSIGGGAYNSAGGNMSTVPGGKNNTASGYASFAAGRDASDGGFDDVFIWGDSGGGTATGANQFNVHASGGILLNGAVQHASDRNMKEAFSFVSARAVLDKVVDMPITKWRFKSEDDSVKHIGPVAQDFMASFGYGSSDKHITATDADGVALAAIQGLHEMSTANDDSIQSLNEKLQEKLKEQSNFNTALRWENAALNARLARLERAILRDDE